MSHTILDKEMPVSKKEIRDFYVVSNRTLAAGRYCLMIVEPADDSPLPDILPGQFVQFAIGTPGVFLRRPISICYVDKAERRLWFLVRDAGRGTAALVAAKPGDKFNVMLPLGNGFTTAPAPERPLLVGGGVGVAPLMQLGADLAAKGVAPEFLLGARTGADQLLLPEFEAIGKLHISTDDGSLGSKGVVTANEAVNGDYDFIYCCGPSPMMKAVAAIARSRGIPCEVSLENLMACGLGACLCCVEKTVKGNICVCTEGPVFNIDLLTW